MARKRYAKEKHREFDAAVLAELRLRCESTLKSYRYNDGQFGIEAGTIAFALRSRFPELERSIDNRGRKVAAALRRLKASGLVSYDDVFKTWSTGGQRLRLVHSVKS